MAAPRWFKLCRLGTRTCVRAVGSVLLWSSWLVLILSLALLVFIAQRSILPVPERVLLRAEQRLAAAGVHVRFGQARFDPQGRVLVDQVQLSLGSSAEPVLTAQSVLLSLDPWQLLLGDVELESIRVSGGRLLVPAMVSPSGRSEPLVRDLEAHVSFADGQEVVQLHQLTARTDALVLHVSGRLPRTPRPARERRSAADVLRQAAALYPRLAQRAAAELARLPRVEGARLELVLQPNIDGPPGLKASLAAERVHLRTGRTGWSQHLTIDEVSAELLLPDLLAGGASRTGTLTSRAAAITAGDAGRTADLQLSVTGEWSPEGLRVDEVAAASSAIEVGTYRVTAPLARLSPRNWPEVAGELTGRAFGDAWAVTVDGNADTRAGAVAWSGRVTPELLAEAGRRVGRNLTRLLSFSERPRVAGRMELAEGGRPRAATARVATGPVRARGVALDAASADLHWQGNRLVAEDIRLVTGMSEARGRYEMDPHTRDFRLFLAGQLQPAAINGWFGGWWPRFWSQFDFGTGAPAADVEVSGRWGDARSVAVFVAADGAPVGLRGAHFDRVRTRLFVRPGYTDVFAFHGDRAGASARGRFTHRFNFASQQWTEIEFDVRGDTDLAPAPALFGSLGESIIAPFAFSTPPRLHVQGRVTSAAAAAGRTADVHIRGDTVGDWTFYDFPLNGLAFTARLQDDRLVVDDLEVGFAGGRGTGRVELRGIESERRLAFDVSVAGARLGESIRKVETWSARRQGQPAPPISRFQRQIAGGRLDLGLSAEGFYDDPYSLAGTGNGIITGADLGEINMLGVLSRFLRPTIFNFTTLQLDTAYADFTLAGRELRFQDLRLSGARALISANGSYRLDTKGLDFTAKVRPFDAASDLFSTTVGAVLSPLTSVLEVKLTGPIEQPAWAFAYGPTSLLRSLTGTPAAPPPAPGKTTQVAH